MKTATIFNQSSGLSTYKDVAYSYDKNSMLLTITAGKMAFSINHFIVDESDECNIKGRGFIADLYSRYVYRYVDVEIKEGLRI